MSNWIIPFVLGIFVGQEIKEVPRVRPYIESGVRKLMEIGREIYDNAQRERPSSDDKNTRPPSTKSWWRSNDDR